MKTILMFLIVAIMTTSIADAQSPIGFVNVNGTLYCTSNGSPGTGGNTPPVFPGATVQVSCSGDVVILWETNTTTNSNGVYAMTLFPRSNGTVTALISNCRISVLTPLSDCNPTLPSSGRLVSTLQFVKTTSIGFLRVTYMMPSGFTLQS